LKHTLSRPSNFLNFKTKFPAGRSSKIQNHFNRKIKLIHENHHDGAIGGQRSATNNTNKTAETNNRDAMTTIADEVRQRVSLFCPPILNFIAKSLTLLSVPSYLSLCCEMGDG
jgi:hypothetical protein